MGHSYGGSNAVTGLYIDNYPLSMQMEFNNKLLNLTEGEADASTLPYGRYHTQSSSEECSIAWMRRNRISPEKWIG